MRIPLRPQRLITSKELGWGLVCVRSPDVLFWLHRSDMMFTCFCFCFCFLAPPDREESAAAQEMSVNGPVWAPIGRAGSGSADFPCPPDSFLRTSLKLHCFYRSTLPCYWTWTMPINRGGRTRWNNKKEKKRKKNSRNPTDVRGVEESSSKPFSPLSIAHLCSFNVATTKSKRQHHGYFFIS